MALLWRAADPALLNQTFRLAVEALLHQSPYLWVIDRGYASLDAQNVLYQRYVAFREGRGPFAGKAAPPGRSAHNFGLAVDVILDTDVIRPGVQPSWNTDLPAWRWLRTACQTNRVVENGWWFGDWPHLQRRDWKIFAKVPELVIT
jgi:hypothetical protein